MKNEKSKNSKSNNPNDSIDSKNVEDSFEASFQEEKKKFEKETSNTLIISLYGEVNVGKSSTINALTGKDLAEVKARSGWTKDIELYQYSENAFIADTPGLKDINKETSKKAQKFIEKDADIILFFINASVGLTDDIVAAFHELKKLNKPILIVLNKIDIWYNDSNELIEPESYNDVINQLKENLQNDIIGFSAKKKINVEELNERILEILNVQGKDLLFAKISVFKDSISKKWILGATGSAFAVGAIPLPGADIVPLTGIQTALAFRIAYIYNCNVTKKDIMQLIGSTITGSLGRHIFRWSIQFLKGAGWISGPGELAVAAVGGLVASSITFGFGYACIAYYKSGMKMDLGEVSEIYKKSYNQYFENNIKKDLKK